MFGGNATDHPRSNDEPDGVLSLHEDSTQWDEHAVVDPEKLWACTCAICRTLCKMVTLSWEHWILFNAL